MGVIKQAILAGAAGAAAATAVYAAGRKKRNHAVLDPGASVNAGGREFRAPELAGMYRPVVHLHGELDLMRPERVLYEVAHAGDKFLINYFVQWPDELHPLRFLRLPHRVFRAVYYGSPRDIEYVQVAVGAETGDVVGVAFERDPSGTPNPMTPKHGKVVARRERDGEDFSVDIDGEHYGALKFYFEDRRVKVLTATWNHIYDFYNGEGVRMPDPPLVYLDDDIYSRYSYSRRSKPPLI